MIFLLSSGLPGNVVGALKETKEYYKVIEQILTEKGLQFFVNVHMPIYVCMYVSIHVFNLLFPTGLLGCHWINHRSHALKEV